jgi:hypothetical protein
VWQVKFQQLHCSFASLSLARSFASFLNGNLCTFLSHTHHHRQHSLAYGLRPYVTHHHLTLSRSHDSRCREEARSLFDYRWSNYARNEKISNVTKSVRHFKARRLALQKHRTQSECISQLITSSLSVVVARSLCVQFSFITFSLTFCVLIIIVLCLAIVAE